jgi:hypothetical protein
MIILRDANGNFVPVKEDDIFDGLMTNSFRFFGMDMDAILELNRQYNKRGGPSPITKDTVRKVFEGD